MKKTITILYGGPGSEHEVSVASAENVIFSLDASLYNLQKIFLTKDMSCLVNNVTMTLEQAIESLPYDAIVIPLLHGAYGEGGVLQKYLEEKNIMYTWSTSKASALAMDKYSAGKVLEESGLTVPKTILTSHKEQKITFSFPVIVKPKDEGSSVDLYKVNDYVSLEKVLKESLIRHKEMLVQECIIGREFTCGVIEKKGEIIPPLPTEVLLTKGVLFDYAAKYTVGGCEEVTPANISESETRKIQDIAIMSHKALGCRDISRTDMIMKENGEIVVLEVNTIPGMTKTSFIPMQVKAAGYTLSEIIGIVIDNHI